MSVLEKLSISLGRRDDEANKKLALELAKKEDRSSIKELVDNLENPDKKIAGNCIKVLYEIGYIKPELIEEYANNFFNLLKDKNNRLVWGGMIALSCIAKNKADIIYENLKLILETMKKGSVITYDRGVKVLSDCASVKKEYNKTIFPYLIKILTTCRSRSFAQYAESVFVTVNTKNKEKYIKILQKRKDLLSNAGKKRIEKILKKI